MAFPGPGTKGPAGKNHRTAQRPSACASSARARGDRSPEKRRLPSSRVFYDFRHTAPTHKATRREGLRREGRCFTRPAGLCPFRLSVDAGERDGLRDCCGCSWRPGEGELSRGGRIDGAGCDAVCSGLGGSGRVGCLPGWGRSACRSLVTWGGRRTAGSDGRRRPLGEMGGGT